MPPLLPLLQRPFEAINNTLLGRNTWPPPAHRDAWAAIELWKAFRNSDEWSLKMYASIPWWRRYLISPVPRIISRANANLLFGAPPEFKAANDADQAALEFLVAENGLEPELHRAAIVTSSEREVWGRIIVDPTLADVPIIEFVSRRYVMPLFRGRFVTGATFFQEWQESASTIYRLLEHYEPGQIRAELYKGTADRLGTQVPLDSYPATKGKQDLVLTGFQRPLCAFIPNTVDADPTAGYGDYQGLEQRFLAINEAATIAQENLRLAGKKRALVDAKYLRRGKLPEGDDLFIRADDEATAGEASKPLQLVEYTFEADQLGKYLDGLIDATLMFGGTAPALIGRDIEGRVISGTALKLRMVHSLMEAAGKGGYFDRGTQALLRMAAVIDSRRTTEGGFGRRWQEPDADPNMIRGDGLPRDDQEAAQWLMLAAGAEAISTEEKVRWLHPHWTDDQVNDEVERIQSEASASAPTTPPGLQTPPTPEGVASPGTAPTTPPPPDAAGGQNG